MENYKDPILFIIIPCYNEEKVLPITAPLFLEKLLSLIERKKISDESKILFIDDGSKDNTWNLISEFNLTNPHFAGIQQSRNRGHQNAVLAGLMTAKECGADITISIDCDGQDDINAMDKMVEEYMNGCDVVYGVRDKRDTDTFFKRFTAQSFYNLLKKLGGDIVYNHADYRLLSCRVLENLADYHEVNIFLRGMIPLIGFKSTSVYYNRIERQAGKSHYNMKAMLALAMNGITSLSIKPIRLITSLGSLVSFISFIGILWVVISHFVNNNAAWGWSSTICIICFLAGVQLLSLGVIGEYIGKIYLETKHRPRFIIGNKTENVTKIAKDGFINE